MPCRSFCSPYQVLWVLITFISLVSAQAQNLLFQWKFANNALSTNIPTCQPLSIIVQSYNLTTNATNGTPPYYMTALAIKGTPQTAFIGTDENNLSWTATHAPGTNLILQVVDANGSPGGIPPRNFTVVPGQTTQCVITPQLDPPFTVTANVTKTLDNCQPWGVTIMGGVPPYTVTLVQPNSPNTTNVTIPGDLNVLTYINRATPGSQLLAAISDLTGRWATGSPIVDTIGSDPNPDCTGLNTSFGNSTVIQGQEAAAALKTLRERRTAVAVALTFIFLSLACLVVSIFICRIKRQQRRALAEEERKPRRFIISTAMQEHDCNDKPKDNDLEAGPGHILSITQFLDPPATGTPQSVSRSMPWHPPLRKNSANSSSSADMTPTTGKSQLSYILSGGARENGGNGAAGPSTPQAAALPMTRHARTRTASFSNFPTRSIRMPGTKAAAAPPGLPTVREVEREPPTPSSAITTLTREPPPPYAPLSRHGRSYSYS